MKQDYAGLKTRTVGHFLSSPKHSQGEFLGYCDVCRKCGRLKCPFVNFCLCTPLRAQF